MIKKRKLTPIELERIQTIKTNARRCDLTSADMARYLSTTTSNIYGTFTGRYSPETTDINLNELETFLKHRLGVRYIKPYFDDLD